MPVLVAVWSKQMVWALDIPLVGSRSVRLVPLSSPPGAVEPVSGEGAGLAVPLLGFGVSAFSGVKSNVCCTCNVIFAYKVFYSHRCCSDFPPTPVFSDYLK